MYKKIYIIALIGAAIVLSINQKGEKCFVMAFLYKKYSIKI